MKTTQKLTLGLSLLFLSSIAFVACGGSDSPGGDGSDSIVPFTATGYTIAYFGEEGIGIDARKDVDVVVNKDGLESYKASEMESPTVGTASSLDAIKIGPALIGRWSDGTLGGTFYGGTHSFGPGEGFHYALLSVAAGEAEIASGSYTSAAATTTTFNDDTAMGPITAKIVIDDSTNPPKAGLSFKIDVGGTMVNAISSDFPDASIEVDNFQGQLRAEVVADTDVCGTDPCTLTAVIFQSTDGEILSMAWQIGGADRLGGAMILKKDQ